MMMMMMIRNEYEMEEEENSPLKVVARKSRKEGRKFSLSLRLRQDLIFISEIRKSFCKTSSPNKFSTFLQP
jgi:hypothetical protein